MLGEYDTTYESGQAKDWKSKRKLMQIGFAALLARKKSVVKEYQYERKWNQGFIFEPVLKNNAPEMSDEEYLRKKYYSYVLYKAGKAGNLETSINDDRGTEATIARRLWAGRKGTGWGGTGKGGYMENLDVGRDPETGRYVKRLGTGESQLGNPGPRQESDLLMQTYMNYQKNQMKPLKQMSHLATLDLFSKVRASVMTKGENRVHFPASSEHLYFPAGKDYVTHPNQMLWYIGPQDMKKENWREKAIRGIQKSFSTPPKINHKLWHIHGETETTFAEHLVTQPQHKVFLTPSERERLMNTTSTKQMPSPWTKGYGAAIGLEKSYPEKAGPNDTRGDQFEYTPGGGLEGKEGLAEHMMKNPTLYRLTPKEQWEDYEQHLRYHSAERVSGQPRFGTGRGGSIQHPTSGDPRVSTDDTGTLRIAGFENAGLQDLFPKNYQEFIKSRHMQPEEGYYFQDLLEVKQFLMQLEVKLNEDREKFYTGHPGSGPDKFGSLKWTWSGKDYLPTMGYQGRYKFYKGGQYLPAGFPAPLSFTKGTGPPPGKPSYTIPGFKLGFIKSGRAPAGGQWMFPMGSFSKSGLSPGALISSGDIAGTPQGMYPIQSYGQLGYQGVPHIGKSRFGELNPFDPKVLSAPNSTRGRQGVAYPLALEAYDVLMAPFNQEGTYPKKADKFQVGDDYRYAHKIDTGQDYYVPQLGGLIKFRIDILGGAGGGRKTSKRDSHGLQPYIERHDKIHIGISNIKLIPDVHWTIMNQEILRYKHTEGDVAWNQATTSFWQMGMHGTWQGGAMYTIPGQGTRMFMGDLSPVNSVAFFTSTVSEGDFADRLDKMVRIAAGHWWDGEDGFSGELGLNNMKKGPFYEWASKWDKEARNFQKTLNKNIEADWKRWVANLSSWSAAGGKTGAPPRNALSWMPPLHLGPFVHSSKHHGQAAKVGSRPHGYYENDESYQSPLGS